ncbi:hypothetical protein P175DRAFT_0269224 [Aspergillus ochraceoroseus IBT 24754]|uniref:Uncharacterized protein n=1 Tax=Aspergillus ochraceoroseus IBT 24754 TaxID=1392256 RepID=A0A2T5LUX3_9EURO|nr:uncharacterized protein P175DRAFT_0269224 [Aspergillus ochraceoroseus IBT 24754]PTU20086.1 hypothetical protein P175DRAFT_0269224 [Aspergillus ochraceoroseus IBT 24754]
MYLAGKCRWNKARINSKHGYQDRQHRQREKKKIKKNKKKEQKRREERKKRKIQPSKGGQDRLTCQKGSSS